jgi:hypothetical protein
VEQIIEKGQKEMPKKKRVDWGGEKRGAWEVKTILLAILSDALYEHIFLLACSASIEK